MAWPKEIPFERYPSDLSDEEWFIVEPILEKANPYTTGRQQFPVSLFRPLLNRTISGFSMAQ